MHTPSMDRVVEASANAQRLGNKHIVLSLADFLEVLNRAQAYERIRDNLQPIANCRVVDNSSGRPVASYGSMPISPERAREWVGDNQHLEQTFEGRVAEWRPV